MRGSPLFGAAAYVRAATLLRSSKGTAESSKLEEATLLDAKVTEKKLSETTAELAHADIEWLARASEQKELLETVARLEQQVKQWEVDATQRTELHQVATADLSQISKLVSQRSRTQNLTAA